MALDAYVGSFNIGTGAAVRQEAVTGVGFLPKVVIWWWNYETSATDSAGSNHMAIGVGFSAGAGSDAVIHGTAEDNQSTSDSLCVRLADSCIRSYTAGASTSEGVADLASFDADGFTLDITTTFTADLRIGFLALGGSDITNVATGSVALSATGAVNVTDPGFEPDGVFIIGGSDSNGVDGGMYTSVGAATGASNEFAVANNSEAGRTGSETGSYGYGGECFALFHEAGSTIVRNRAEFTQFTANGFDINVLEHGIAAYFEYLVIKGASFAVGDILTRTDGNDIAVSGLGFDPGAVMFVSHCQAESTQDTAQTDSMFSIGAASAINERVAHGTSDQNGSNPSECMSIIEHDAVYVKPDLADGIAAIMDIKSFDTGGFTCVMDDTEPSAGSFVGYVAVGPAAAGGLSGPIAMNYYAQQ